MRVRIPETFKPVPGYPKYEVSTLGRIRWRNRFGHFRYKKPKKDYVVVLCNGQSKRWDTALARVILTVFVGPPPPGKSQARHLDDDRSNNHLSNLAWGSAWDNMQDKIRNGGTTKGRPLSIETRRKIGEAQKGKIITEEVRKKISATKKGKKLTEVHKEKIRASCLGINQGPRPASVKLRIREAVHRSLRERGIWK
jgi:HNH endonuclease/NUMOD4 motif/NUMOD3 motif